MQCPRCLNEDPAYFYHGSRGWYCRRCISFSRVMLEEEQMPVSLSDVGESASEYTLQYPLTPAQQEISHACAQAVKASDVLIDACTGAGKTELVAETIAIMLQQKKKVCFAIPRRQVVLELADRLQKIFARAKVTAVCGGHTEQTDGDLILCTTHQLYRYYQAFDCLILDEPDAFPFRGNPVLHGIAETACRGHRVYLTATPDETLRQQVRRGSMICLQLSRRPHGVDLPVPQLTVGPVFWLIICLLRWLVQHQRHPRLVFVPTIRQAKTLRRLLSVCFECFECTSKTADRDEVIRRFRAQPAGLMVATTVMERGVTIPGVDICVYEADSPIFDEAGLIQMSGRAGRTFEHPTGDCLFLLKQRSRTAESCVASIRQANAS